MLADRHVQVAHGEFSPDWLAASEFNISLFAMGYDSFKLALSLFDGSKGLGKGIVGLTGIVSRAPDGRLQRELAWTRVEEGNLTAAPATP